MKQPIQKFEFDIAQKAKELFTYSLAAEVLLDDCEILNNAVTITLHGSGDNKEQGRNLKTNKYLQGPVMIFNFPDHDIPDWNTYDFETSTFGSIEELLSAFFLLKQCLDFGIEKISLYGFSAGGGALINILAVLNSDKHANDLKRIGITQYDRLMIINALSNGLIILDCPLRSVDEIIDFHGETPDMVILSKKYRENEMIPINRLDGLRGLSLNILVHFKNEDEVFSDRDVNVYVERLKKYNKNGKTIVICGSSGKHNDPSIPLWKQYCEYLQQPAVTRRPMK
tara:strand:+ start:1018 stop:1866 length:849 start_codon:yes stop_codon:yes gene_type:complete